MVVIQKKHHFGRIVKILISLKMFFFLMLDILRFNNMSRQDIQCLQKSIVEQGIVIFTEGQNEVLFAYSMRIFFHVVTQVEYSPFPFFTNNKTTLTYTPSKYPSSPYPTLCIILICILNPFPPSTILLCNPIYPLVLFTIIVVSFLVIT